MGSTPTAAAPSPRGSRGGPPPPAKGALRARADAREQGLIRAALLERGLEPGAGDAEARKKAAIRAVDELIAQFPDDEEALYFRAQLGGGAGGFGGAIGGVPFYHALLRVNPLHPGANHELVHFYETFRRPALGWDTLGVHGLDVVDGVDQ